MRTRFLVTGISLLSLWVTSLSVSAMPRAYVTNEKDNTLSVIDMNTFEVTDTLVIVVSEETGQFSAMRNGKVFNNLSAQELRKRINEYLKEKDNQTVEKAAKKSG